MLSICIPHYNHINPKLFIELRKQCLELSIVFEILIIDDESTVENKSYLDRINSDQFNVLFLKKNIGRSKIRNLLANKAKYDWLLFLDGDSTIINPNFIKCYLNNLNAHIISGGRAYSLNKPTDSYFLHWNYGVKIEAGSKAQFHSNNFMIKKEVFNQLMFDEKIINYGYEDVVFGLEAKKIGLTLINIDNKVLHTGLKTNTEFLRDVEQALINLCKIEVLRGDLTIHKEVKILKNYNKLRSIKLHWILNIFNFTIIKLLKRHLIHNNKLCANKMLAILKIYQLHQIKTHKK